MTAFVWGFNRFGQVGNGRTDTVHTPFQVRVPNGVESIICGGYCTAVITSAGNLYTFGCAKYGRLGTGDETDRIEPFHIQCRNHSENVKFKKVSCGIWHGAAISDSGELYVWGYGKAHGVMGSPDIPHLSGPTLLKGPFSGKVAGVSCGNNFTLLWTTEGDAYSWGCGRHGVLGHGDEADKLTPTLISKFKEMGACVCYMNAGFAHCGVVTADKQVCMFGKAQDGALGIGNDKSKPVTSPTLVEGLQGKNISELSCSVGEKHGHTLFASKDGGVYSCGDGYKGKLGHGDQESRLTPTLIPVENFNAEKISHVAAGGIHSTAVSMEGHVFTWGCGSDGRLGHPDGKGHRYLFRSDVPRIVEDLVKVGTATDICCSYYHTAALVKPNS